MPQYDFALAAAHLAKNADRPAGLFTDDILRVVLHLRAGDGSNIDAFARAFGQARFEKVPNVMKQSRYSEGVKLVYRARALAFVPERLRDARVAWTFSENYTPANKELTNYSTVGYVGALHALHFLHTCGKLRKEYHARLPREPLFRSEADYETCVRDLRRYCVHNRVFQWEFAREDEMHGYELPRIWWHAPTNGARFVQPFVMPAAPARNRGNAQSSGGDEPAEVQVREVALGSAAAAESEDWNEREATLRACFSCGLEGFTFVHTSDEFKKAQDEDRKVVYLTPRGGMAFSAKPDGEWKKKRVREEPAQNEISASGGQKRARADVSPLHELARAASSSEAEPEAPPTRAEAVASASVRAEAMENDLRRARGSAESPEPAVRSYADLLDEYVRKWDEADSIVSAHKLSSSEAGQVAVRAVLEQFTKYARAARVELARAYSCVYPMPVAPPIIPLDFTFTPQTFQTEGLQVNRYNSTSTFQARVNCAVVKSMNVLVDELADDVFGRVRREITGVLDEYARANRVPFMPPHATH